MQKQFCRIIATCGAAYLIYGSGSALSRETHPSYSLCPGVEILNSSVHFSEEERRLICGDPAQTAWKNIPDNQRFFYLRNFLQARGFFHPSFTPNGTDLKVDPGSQTRVSQLRAVGAPVGFEVAPLRKIVGEILAPSLLDQVKARVLERVELLGYPCPQIQIAGDPNTGVVEASIKTGSIQNLSSVREEKVSGLDEKLFRRFDAFSLGDRYNPHRLSVTTNRTLDSGAVQSTHFVPTCTPNGADLEQHFVAGPPREISFAAGVDSERYLIFRASWKNSRLGKYASTLYLSTEDSFRDQSVSADLKWYYLSFPSRHFLMPSFSFKHENIAPFENLTAKLQLFPAITWDTENLGYSLSGGPLLTFTDTIRGSSVGYVDFLSFGTTFRIFDHEYEFYRKSPRVGFDLSLRGNFADEGLLSTISAQQVSLDFTHLWNFKGFDPPLFVFGFRTFAATTFTDSPSVAVSALPPEFRYFLGGSPDLRGFGYRELPGPDGGFTALTFSLEARLADVLPFGIQPFVFADAGWLGNQSLSLSWPVYWSPGFGVRVEAPFGVIRATLAKGLIDGDNASALRPGHSHLQPFFSFGEEF